MNKKTNACTLLLLSFISMFLICTADLHAESYSVSVELLPQTQSLDIGRQLYITQDQEEILTYNTLLDRHKNGLRGKRDNSSVKNLGFINPGSWFILNINNNTDATEWVLDFGHLLSGRQALSSRLFVYNETITKTLADLTYSDSKTSKNNTLGHYSTIELAPNKSNVLAIYIETEGPFPSTIHPKIVSKATFEKQLYQDSIIANLLKFSFITLAGVFVFLAVKHKNWQYLLFSAMYCLHTFVFLSLLNSFVAQYSYMGEIMSSSILILMLCGVASCKFYFNIEMQNRKDLMILGGAAAFLALSLLINMLHFSTASSYSSVLLFLSVLAASISIIVVSVSQMPEHSYSSPHFAAGWASFALGWLILSLVNFGLISANFITLDFYWLCIAVQGVLLTIGLTKRIQLENEEMLQLQARQARESLSLHRLKQSKETADQARLLRIIDREREVMSELRERERLRTEEMRNAKESADEANNAKSAFLAVVSHEIRTPMTGILGMVRLLQETKLSKSQNEYTTAIQKSGDTMMALLNDILDFEKIETGNMKLEIIQFDLHKLISGIVTLMSGYASEKGVFIKSDIDKDAPNIVEGDPTRLRQVILNLVNNALKFTQDGGVILHLKAKKIPQHQGDAGQDIYDIYFAVEDTGIGISKAAIDNLFAPFQQADDSTTRNFGGTGLGLAICKKLINAMGSSIEVNSIENEGSTFYFNLRMKSADDEEILENKKNDPDKLYDTPSLKILVIEDNEMNRRVLNGFLDKLGHKAILTESGEEGLQKFVLEDIDVVLSDMNLQGMSGYDTALAIRALPNRQKASIPIIALTGNVQQSDKEHYFTANINGVLPKPIDLKKLAETLHNAYTNTLENPIQILGAVDTPVLQAQHRQKEPAPTQPETTAQSLPNDNAQDGDDQIIPASTTTLAPPAPARGAARRKDTSNTTLDDANASPIQRYIKETENTLNDPLLHQEEKPPLADMHKPEQLEKTDFSSSTASDRGTKEDGTDTGPSDENIDDNNETENEYDHIFGEDLDSDSFSESITRTSLSDYDTIKNDDEIINHDKIKHKPPPQQSEEAGSLGLEQNLSYDTVMLKELLESLGSDQVITLVNDCFEFADNIITELEESSRTPKAKHMEQRAHELKGMAANFGLVELARLSGELETEAQKSNIPTCLEIIELLSPENKNAQQSINMWLSMQS